MAYLKEVFLDLSFLLYINDLPDNVTSNVYMFADDTSMTHRRHPPPALTLSPRYMNSLTVSTSYHNFSSCSTHLLCIHFPCCTHKTELAFAFKLQTSSMSTLLLDKLSFVMPPLTITVVFPRLAFKPLFSKASFYFKNLFLSPLIVSLVWTKSSAYSNSFSAPSMANSVTTPTSTAKRKCNRTDPWYVQGGVVYCSYFFSVIYCQCEYLKASFFKEKSVLPFIIIIIKVIICVYV